MFDVGDRDLPVPTSGNWVIQGCMTKWWRFLRFCTFFWKFKKHEFLRFSEMLHTFSRTLVDIAEDAVACDVISWWRRAVCRYRDSTGRRRWCTFRVAVPMPWRAIRPFCLAVPRPKRLDTYTASQKTYKLWNGIAQNFNDRFWWFSRNIQIPAKLRDSIRIRIGRSETGRDTASISHDARNGDKLSPLSATAVAVLGVLVAEHGDYSRQCGRR